MHYINDIRDLIGNTPLLKLNTIPLFSFTSISSPKISRSLSISTNPSDSRYLSAIDLCIDILSFSFFISDTYIFSAMCFWFHQQTTSFQIITLLLLTGK